MATLQRSTDQESQLNHPRMPDHSLYYNLPQGPHHSFWSCPACGPAVSERQSDDKPKGIQAGNTTDQILK